MSLDDNIHQAEKEERKLVRVGKGLIDILGGALKGGIIFLTAGIVVHSGYLMLPKTIRYTTITEKNYYFDKDEENKKEKGDGTNESMDFQDKKDKKQVRMKPIKSQFII